MNFGFLASILRNELTLHENEATLLPSSTSDSTFHIFSDLIIMLCVIFYSAAEYGLQNGDINLSAIRTIRVLRPLRAINRIPSKAHVKVMALH